MLYVVYVYGTAPALRRGYRLVTLAELSIRVVKGKTGVLRVDYRPLYEVTVGCSVCKRMKGGKMCAVRICPPSSQNTRGANTDLDIRDCWARHQIYGLPAAHERREDWRGPWWVGYDRYQRDKAQNKRQRLTL